MRISLFDGYKPHDKQRAAHEDNARFMVVCAGRRAGKTYWAAREFLKRVFRDYAAAAAAVERGAVEPWAAASSSARAARSGSKRGKDKRRKAARDPWAWLGPEVKPFLHYWVVAPTYALSAVLKQEIFSVLGARGGESPLLLKWNKSLNELWLVGGIKIEFKSADDPQALVSVGLDGVLMDEAARVKPNTWAEQIEPTLSNKRGWAIFISTPLGQNWFFEELWQNTNRSTREGGGAPGWSGYSFETADNTAVPGLAEEQARAEKILSRAIFLRNYKADFNAFDGKIYDEFLDDSTHIITPRDLPPRFVRKIAGVDWGYTNPGVIVEVGFDGEGGAYVYRETYRAGLLLAPIEGAGVESWVDHFEAAAKSGVEVFYCDPSEPEHIQTIKIALAARGVNARIVAGFNAVGDGIGITNAYLKPDDQGAAALKILDHCSNLRRELSTYRWAPGAIEAPVKEHDHSCDALRYALYSEYRLTRRKPRALTQLSLNLFERNA